MSIQNIKSLKYAPTRVRTTLWQIRIRRRRCSRTARHHPPLRCRYSDCTCWNGCSKSSFYLDEIDVFFRKNTEIRDLLNRVYSNSRRRLCAATRRIQEQLCLQLLPISCEVTSKMPLENLLETTNIDVSLQGLNEITEYLHRLDLLRKVKAKSLRK